MQRVCHSVECFAAKACNRLLNAELAHLHQLESQLGGVSPVVLALRMLYISLQLPVLENTYHEFLTQMDPRLLPVLTPMHVLCFWQKVANIQSGQRWMAVIAVDEVSAALHDTC